MSERENGFYWVRLEGDPQWWVAKWDADRWITPMWFNGIYGWVTVPHTSHYDTPLVVGDKIRAPWSVSCAHCGQTFADIEEVRRVFPGPWWCCTVAYAALAI